MRISSTGQTTISGNTIVSVTDNTNAALRITQLGTGNALLVEDSANPDSSPFAIDSEGRVLVGFTTSVAAVSTQNVNVQISGVGSTTGQSITRYSADAGTNQLLLQKSRGALGAQGVVSSGDPFGQVEFAGSDGTAFIAGARIRAEVDGTPGTNDMPGRLVFSTTADGASSPTERMRISSTGIVTIPGSISARYTTKCTNATTATSITPDISAANQYSYTALASALTINAPTGTPVDGDKLTLRIKDNGTSQALSWNAIYRVIGTVLPTATVANKLLYVGCIYNAADTKWDVTAVAREA
jgi:hypothetical protein